MATAKKAPLKISCTMSDCGNNLHCFRATRQMKKQDKVGACRQCGERLVDWPRVHLRELSDAANTFSETKKELIRHHFWHKEIDQQVLKRAMKLGLKGLEEHARHRLEKYVAPKEYAWDGRQTPFEGDVVFFAQHATACCCRKCIEYWHGIPQGRELTSAETGYFTELLMRYIRERLPNLPP
jgi:hypothetical protein